MAQCLGNLWKNCSSIRVYIISGLIFWGQGDKQDFFQKKCSCFYTNIFLDEKNCFPRFLATIVNLPNIAGALNIFFGTIANHSEPSYTTNQDATLLLHVPDQLMQCHHFLSLPTWRLFSTHLFQTGNTCLNCRSAAVSTHQAAAQNSGAHWIRKIEINGWFWAMNQSPLFCWPILTILEPYMISWTIATTRFQGLRNFLSCTCAIRKALPGVMDKATAALDPEPILDCWLVVYLPLSENMSLPVGMMTFPIY